MQELFPFIQVYFRTKSTCIKKKSGQLTQAINKDMVIRFNKA